MAAAAQVLVGHRSAGGEQLHSASLPWVYIIVIITAASFFFFYLRKQLISTLSLLLSFFSPILSPIPLGEGLFGAELLLVKQHSTEQCSAPFLMSLETPVRNSI